MALAAAFIPVQVGRALRRPWSADRLRAAVESAIRAGLGPAPDALGGCGWVLSVRFAPTDERQVDVARTYGDIRPRADECLVVLSTGAADPQDVEFDWNGNPSAAFDLDHSAHRRDVARATLRGAAPPEARGIEIPFLFLTSEWPEYLCADFDDRLEIRVEGPGGDFDVAWDRAGSPISVHSAELEHPDASSVPLESTPFGQPPDCRRNPPVACPDTEAACESRTVGASTGWLAARAPVRGGAWVTVVVEIADIGDAVVDSTVLFGRPHWLTKTPVPGARR